MAELSREQIIAIARARARAAAASGGQDKPTPNPDGTYGSPPPDMFMNPGTGQMTSRELMKNAMPMGPGKAAGTGFMQGYSLNAADEFVGGIAGDFAREKFRAQDEAAQEYPLSYFLGQITGNVTSPVTKVAGPVKSVKGAAGLAAAEGTIDAFNRQEGGLDARLDKRGEILLSGLFSGITGGATSAVLKVGSPALRKLFTKSAKRPTLENLKATKNAAYNAVDNAGVRFSPDDMKGLYDRVSKIAADADFDDAADPQTKAVLSLLERRQGEEMSLSRLDKIRQTLWRRYHQSGDKEGIILDAIWEIDGLIENSASGNDAMQAARLANSKYSKAKLLEEAFRKARLQTSATGSGGNILNKYRQAVVSIVTNPKHSRWFSPEEIALMERFVEGDDVENALRKIGKLSPGGNGLMTALNVYAASVDPTMLTLTGAASAAKAGADASAMRGSEGLLDAVSTGVIPRPPSSPSLEGAGASGVGISEFLKNVR